MGEITASAVADLRQRTGAGMMDCKKALTEQKETLKSDRDSAGKGDSESCLKERP